MTHTLYTPTGGMSCLPRHGGWGMRRRRPGAGARLLFSTVALCAVQPAIAVCAKAQITTPASPGKPARANADIEVEGQRPPPPALVLDQAAIATYAASNIGELIEQFARQIGGGPPAVLIDGKRASPVEFLMLPPEAIDKLELLSPEAAALFGFGPNQRVLNIKLRKLFNALTTEPSIRAATEGGRTESAISSTLTSIRGFKRVNLGVTYQQSSALYESERGLNGRTSYGLYDPLGNVTSLDGVSSIDSRLDAQVGTSVPGVAVPQAASSGVTTIGQWVNGANMANAGPVGAYRTLMPSSGTLTVSGAFNGRAFSTVPVGVTLKYTRNESDSAVGLPLAMFQVPAGNPFSPFTNDVTLYRAITDAGPLMSHSLSQGIAFTAMSQGNVGRWTWVANARADANWGSSHTDRSIDTSGIAALITSGDAALNPFGPLPLARLQARQTDTNSSLTYNGGVDATLFGAIFSLPAGRVAANLRLSAGPTGFDNTSHIAGQTIEREAHNFITDLNASLIIPLLARNSSLGHIIGDVSATVSLRRNSQSHLGAAQERAYTLTWSPVPVLSLRSTLNRAESLPPIDQRSAAVQSIPNVPVFDFVQGKSVAVTQITGGNVDLLAQNLHGFSLDAQLTPRKSKLMATVGYRQSDTLNGIGSLPALSAEVEAAFPERFTRAADGSLTAIDLRPINLERARTRSLTSTIYFATAFGARHSPPPSALSPLGALTALTGSKAADRRAAAGGSDSAAMIMTDPSRGRLTFSLSHEWALENSVLLRDGLPSLDLLHSATVSGRAPSTHTLAGQMGVARGPYTFNIDAKWLNGSTVPAAGGDLHFSALTTINARLTATAHKDAGLGKRMPWADGLRASLEVTNLFNARTQVRDSAGQTPTIYAAPYLDPLGRAVKLTLRKLLL